MQVLRTESGGVGAAAAPMLDAGPALPAISVIGLGYVGAVSIACLANLGFRMVGVDVSLEKVRAIKEGRSPIVEERLGELLTAGVEKGRITATQNLVAAVLETNVTFMSVGTPTAPAI